MFSLAYVLMWILAFGVISNFGILARQRTQMYPFFFVLLSVAAVIPKPQPTAADAVPAEQNRGGEQPVRRERRGRHRVGSAVRAPAPGSGRSTTSPSRSCSRSASVNRVLGLLGSAVRDGAFPVTDAQREDLARRWEAWLAHAVRVERVLLEILDAFEPEPVTILALKGLALAHTSYPDPNARVFGDVDVLVAPGGLHRAAQVLVSTLGGTRAEPELRPGFDDRFGREAMVRVHTIEVDLHRTFVNGAYGSRIRLESLFAAPERITVGGREVPVPAPAHRLLHAAYTFDPLRLAAAPGRLPRPRPGHHPRRPDPGDGARCPRAWRAEAVLAAGVTDAWRALRLTDRPALLEWAQRYRSTRRDRVLMAASRGPARGYTSQLTSVIAIPGLRARIVFLRAITWPSREYRDARHLGRFGLLGSGARRAMQR